MKKDEPNIDWKTQCESFKKYLKENPVKKSKSPWGVQKRRSKKDPIPVREVIDLGFQKEPDTITLCVIASPEDWEKLDAHFEDSLFIIQFRNKFIYPALQEHKKKLPRGKNKAPTSFMQELKIRAGVLYAFFSYWIKKPVAEWPVYLRKLKIDSDLKESFLKESSPVENRKNPTAFTAYCLEKVYSERLKHYGLNPFFSDSDNFYYSYIHDNRRLSQRFTKKHIENKEPHEVEQLGYIIPALRAIFTALGLI